MRKIIFLSLMALAFNPAFSQFCADNVVENLEADINFGQLEVDFSWDFNDPISCGPIVCPPYLVSYEMEVQFGTKPFGPLGPTSWGAATTHNFSVINIDLIHSYSVPITSKFEYVRFRVKIDGCSNWDGWVTTSIWD